MIKMTGREWIMYIVSNKLEDKSLVPSQDGSYLLTVDEAATYLNVGPATIEAMAKENTLKSMNIGGELYIIAKIKLELLKTEEQK